MARNGSLKKTLCAESSSGQTYYQRIVAKLLPLIDLQHRRYRGMNGETAVHVCAASGAVGMLALLLKRNAQPETWDNDGETPLHYAALAGQAATATILLNHGANLTARSFTRVPQTPLEFSQHNPGKFLGVDARLVRDVLERAHNLLKMQADPSLQDIMSNPLTGYTDGATRFLDWNITRAFYLCDEGQEDVFLGKDCIRLDKDSVKLVSCALEGLNRGILDCPRNFCIAFSSPSKSYFVLYRYGKIIEAYSAVGKQLPPWRGDNAFWLCEQGEECVHSVGHVDVFNDGAVDGINDAVRALNAGKLTCSKNFCVVLSSHHRSYFVLYRHGTYDEARKCFPGGGSSTNLHIAAAMSRMVVL
eukprot:gnl/TRDRNA2_/TRDRNA2_202831_c0_seq1.p1 gnl/TRDRNA2_/TRDRNA2_202831_c0~~gnl/TRDRNA2_/TRDRNA2_202831_c0_seq1.p1  ORF type:complete len:360 (-),score=36.02 gnl/TRDRNA2_/TRDRNA2_202831_c0_seq1:10-1089(-)